MNAMILAAGEGTRLRPYTAENPKPCIPFLSVPLLCYSLSLLDDIEISRLVVNSHHLPEKIKSLSHLLPSRWKNFEISQEETLLDSGGGIHKAKAKLQGKGSFFVLNGDGVILPHQIGLLKEMAAFHKWHGGLATLLTMEHPDVGVKFGGAWLGAEGHEIQCFSKKPPGLNAPRGLHFTGALLLSDKIFDYFSPEIEIENILYGTLTRAMKAGEKVHSFQSKVEWYETGNAVDFMKATEYCFEALSTPDENRPFWQEHLKQTIRLYSTGQHVVESGWDRLPELKALIKQVKKGF